MQSRIVLQVARHGRQTLRVPVAPSHRRSSFIQQVMEQVKRDAENDPKLKADLDKVSKSAEHIRTRGGKKEEQFSEYLSRAKEQSEKASEILKRAKEKSQEAVDSMSAKATVASEQNESLKQMFDFVKTKTDTGSAASSAVYSKTKDTLAGGVDRMSQAFTYLHDDSKGEKQKQWKANRDVLKAATERKEAAAAAKSETDTASDKMADAVPEEEPGNGLVVSQTSQSSWDRMGASLRDMPFLNSAFENPFFDRMFGESEIAASIREMKEIDGSFLLEEFADDVENVIAPHIIKSYLEGDEAGLERHCGEAAFAAVNSSMKARKTQKLELDPSILSGPNDVELKGAKMMEKGAPCFIWTFSMQQVNCLRDSCGDIIEGDVDDIRTVHYAMAIARHPALEELDLEYPWQVSELAILGNQPCW